MNVWSVTGRLGKDAEVRDFADSGSVTKSRLAVNFGYGEKRGTVWVTLVIWGKYGKVLADDLTTGRLVVVSGELKEDKWTDRDGNERTSLELHADSVLVVKPDDGDEDESEPRKPEPEDDLPF